jgi:hypothetical protein
VQHHDKHALVLSQLIHIIFGEALLGHGGLKLGEHPLSELHHNGGAVRLMVLYQHIQGLKRTLVVV